MSKKHGKGQKVKTQRVRLRGDASEAAALRIEELARGLRSGVIHIADGDVAIEVPAGSDLSWEIEARSGRRKSRIEIEIRWRAPKAPDDDDEEEDEDEDEEEDEEDDSESPVAEADAEPATENAAGSSTETPPATEEEKPSSELENPAW